MKVLNRLSGPPFFSRFKDFIVLVLILCGIISSSMGQSTRTYTKEIEVDGTTNIESNIPASINLQVNGTIMTNNTYNMYTINGKKNEIRLNVLKELKIETWEKDVVKQETVITVKRNDAAAEKVFLDNLNLKLNDGLNHRVFVDCNLNIETFTLKNGWFKNDDCKVLLENGTSYSVDFLSIETRLIIPKSSNLKIKGEKNCTILLDDLDGNLNLDLKYAEVHGANINQLEARLRWCYNVFFDYVKNAKISATNSYVDIKKADQISVGEFPIGYQIGHFNSTQSKYSFGEVGELIVDKSVSDHFNLNEVSIFNAQRVNYSNFKIRKLLTSAKLQGQSSDLSVAKILKSFKDVTVNSSFSHIDLMVDDDAQYTLEMDLSKYIEKEINKKMEVVDEENKFKGKYNVGDGENGSKIYINCEKCKFLFN